MREGEIERLLGGYATNTLTAAERQALFEAALENQHIFNALEDEQALRELLEDSGSRRMIAAALTTQKPAVEVSWFRKPWAWGALACAAAGLAVAFVLWQPSPRVVRYEVATARVDSAAPQQPVAVAPAPPLVTQVRQHAKKTDALPANSPALALPPSSVPETVQVQAAAPVLPMRDAANELRAGAEAQLQPPRSGIVYTVLRRGSGDSFAPVAASESLNAGDSVKLRVEAPVSGSLQLVQQGLNGDWTPLYPAAGRVPVTAHQQYTIPEEPIRLGAAGKHLRLLFVSASPFATALTTGAVQALARSKERYANEPSPVTGRTKAMAAPASQVKSAAIGGAADAITTDIVLAPGKPAQ